MDPSLPDPRLHDPLLYDPHLYDPNPLPVPASVTAESPFWHPTEQVLYWCDIPSFKVHRFNPAANAHDEWRFDTDVACAAPLLEGGLLLGLRSGLWRFDPATNERELLEKPPYDPKLQRFNDGKADPQGRFWASTIDDARKPEASLYRYRDERIDRMHGGFRNGNGLGWSPDGRTMYWSDTKGHEILAFDFDGADGSLSRKRVFASFPEQQPGQDLATYGGRPDGAAVDSEGCYWASMFEGGRLLRLSPAGEVMREVTLPVRCPTMPCFGGPDLKTLYVSTSREHRPADELARQPWAGCVLHMRVEVPGLPVNFARL